MRRVGFDVVNTAAYSPRPNTPAARWTDQLSEEVRARGAMKSSIASIEFSIASRARIFSWSCALD